LPIFSTSNSYIKGNISTLNSIRIERTSKGFIYRNDIVIIDKTAIIKRLVNAIYFVTSGNINNQIITFKDFYSGHFFLQLSYLLKKNCIQFLKHNQTQNENKINFFSQR
jgi:hypothetical protein